MCHCKNGIAVDNKNCIYGFEREQLKFLDIYPVEFFYFRDQELNQCKLCNKNYNLAVTGVVLECGFVIFLTGRGNVAGLVFKKIAGLRVAGRVLFSWVSRVNKIFINQMYLFLSESILIYAKTREFKPATFLAGF